MDEFTRSTSLVSSYNLLRLSIEQILTEIRYLPGFCFGGAPLQAFSGLGRRWRVIVDECPDGLNWASSSSLRLYDELLTNCFRWIIDFSCDPTLYVPFMSRAETRKSGNVIKRRNPPKFRLHTRKLVTVSSIQRPVHFYFLQVLTPDRNMIIEISPMPRLIFQSLSSFPAGKFFGFIKMYLKRHMLCRRRPWTLCILPSGTPLECGKAPGPPPPRHRRSSTLSPLLLPWRMVSEYGTPSPNTTTLPISGVLSPESSKSRCV